MRSRVLADMPFFAVVTCQAASNHVVNGVRVLSKIVPAVTVHWCRQAGQTKRPRVCFQGSCCCWHAGHTKPLGHRSRSRYSSRRPPHQQTFSQNPEKSMEIPLDYLYSSVYFNRGGANRIPHFSQYSHRFSFQKAAILSHILFDLKKGWSIFETCPRNWLNKRTTHLLQRSCDKTTIPFENEKVPCMFYAHISF